LILAFFLPLYLGGVLLPGERFVLFCLLNVFIVGFRSVQNRFVRRAAFSLCVMLGGASYFYAIYNTSLFNTMIRTSRIPSDAIAHPNSRLGGTNGFLHFHYYEDIAKERAATVFEVGLFSQRDSLPHE
jgi:hypothetical protein